MKAIVIEETGSPDVLRLQEVPTPTPGPGQVLVKTHVAGINFADTAQRKGTYPLPLQLPVTPGFEVGGTVTELGPDVSTARVGDRVAVFLAAPGGYAEYLVADAATLIPVPDHLSFEQAVALLVQGLTAYFLLQQAAPMQPGQRVLVHAAAGGVGSLAVQLAKLLGAGQVIATASTPTKLDLTRRLGADVAINYSDADWPAQVLAATNGQGVDTVLDSVSGTVGDQSLAVLAPFGRWVSYGAPSTSGTQIGAEQVMQMIFRNQSFVGFALYGITPERIQQALQVMFAYVGEGKLQVIVDQTFPLADAAVAHRAIEERRTTGKVLLVA
ncbi:quinone oxidoreductase family protein [Hymenobacter terrenus]|uniref:quinone oxidoreductase family protein n=1 Tax=Hymenobacter terrenus TaxID=1629124 RepID=UPI0006198B5E|nr:quinone oxidoreductase [Hymenobacter terrenus]